MQHGGRRVAVKGVVESVEGSPTFLTEGGFIRLSRSPRSLRPLEPCCGQQHSVHGQRSRMQRRLRSSGRPALLAALRPPRLGDATPRRHQNNTLPSRRSRPVQPAQILGNRPRHRQRRSRTSRRKRLSTRLSRRRGPRRRNRSAARSASSTRRLRANSPAKSGAPTCSTARNASRNAGTCQSDSAAPILGDWIKSHEVHRVKEASKGYFHDYNALRHQGGKAYLAPKTLIREDVGAISSSLDSTRLLTKE